MIQQTTALRKIAALSKRIWGIQGGQGAGKTFAVLILIINHALWNPNREIFIASAELSKMRITVIKDFIGILREFGVYNSLYVTDRETRFVFTNGSFVKFIGLDKEDIGKGLRSHIMFINEANKIKFETYRELTARAKRVIVDFNPNEKFWYHTEVLTREDSQHLTLTYLDNEYCPQNEIDEVHMYKKKGYDPDGNIINEYWANKWRIYGLGEVGSVEGRIFYWKSIPYRDWLQLEVPVYYSVDWGTVDPFAIGCDKYYDGAIYTHELNYDSENELRRKLTETQLKEIAGHNDDGLVTWLFNRLGVDKKRPAICDNNRPGKIRALREAGWDYAVAVRKEEIISGINLLQNLDVYYTEPSKNIENEQEVYSWAKDRWGNQTEAPVDYSNHHIDRIRYTATFLQQEGVIRVV